MGTDQRILEIEKRLAEIHRERQQLLAELGLLREDEQLSITSLGPLGSAASETVPTGAEEKVSLFLKLFRCRESVYPRLWENHKQNKKGYAPACSNEWREGVCDKPRIKCSDCPNQAFLSLDETAVRRHLEGKETVGTYAIRQDDTCTFLAADFDGDGWKDDVSAYKAAGSEIGVQVSVERSRSGNGAHGWIFFQEPVPAHLARQLGTVIVARATASSPSMNLGTYDRFFPNQDYLPKGGFGNLIALPLQRRARECENSVFIDDNFQSIPDQWSTLASAKRLSYLELKTVLDKTIPKEKGPAFIRYEDQGIRLAERVLDSGRRKVKADCYPGQIEISLDSHTRISISGLPKSIVAAFKRTATFANPIFFEKERMRFSTWNVPRFVFCGEIQGELLSLPRGVLDQCLEICDLAGSSVVLKDQRPHHKKLKLTFSGELSAEQRKTVSAICGQDTGVLMAPPGAGKTVMACAVMARRKARTLVLVHRMQLLEQWKKQISIFLGVPEKEIGVIASAKRKQTGRIDIGMLQTVTKIEEADEFLAQYEQIIIDECHHIPATSFESVLNRAPAKCVLGLTATPYRKDGHQSIIHMQCGPIRYEMKMVDGVPLRKRVVVRETRFQLPAALGPQPPIHMVWEHLVADDQRLSMVADDAVAVLSLGRFPLVISERKQHLTAIAEKIREKLGTTKAKGFLFTGELGNKARAKMLEEIQLAISQRDLPYILATGSFIGEGFDLPALDTLLIAMPISFKGKLIQYAGRLHRPHATKSEVIIYDYVDTSSPLTISMFRKRAHAYRKIDYALETPTDFKWHLSSRDSQQEEFSP